MEKEVKVNNPKTWKTPPVTITTSIKNNLWNSAQEFNISWKEALEYGIMFLIADKDLTGFSEYPPSNLKDKMNFYRIELEKLNKNIKTPREEANEEFKRLGI